MKEEDRTPFPNPKFIGLSSASYTFDYLHKVFRNYQEKILSDNEIDYDLGHIIKICKEIFNENIEVHIIPHLNLKTKLNNSGGDGKHKI
jgi:hypothetical protein